MKIQKKDIIIIVTILIIAGVIFIFNIIKSNSGETVKVTVDGSLYKKYPLNKDGLYEIKTKNGTNTIKIKNGMVSMEDATCKNQVCVNHKSISKDNESIICLPNKVVVTIVSDKENNIDDIAK